MAGKSRTRERDPLLDLWRGLALIDMTWVHLALYPIGMPPALAAWIGQHTRFAAGAFVLISGMAVARVFGAMLQAPAEIAWQGRRRLLRRALMLLCVDRLIAIAFVVIERFRLVPPAVTPSYPDITDLLLFQLPGVTGGLLTLYAVLLAATPLLDAGVRRFGAAAALTVSLSIYGIASSGILGSHGASWPFPFAFWQPLFVLGYVVSRRLEHLRTRDGNISAWWLAIVSFSFAALFVVRNGASLDILAPGVLPDWSFVKVPLSPSELAWYMLVSAFVLTWSAWLWEHSAWMRSLLGWLCLLGRKSLLVYAAHLFIELPILELLTLVDPSPLGRSMMLPLAAAMLVGVAAAGERLDRALAGRPITRRVTQIGFRLPTSGMMGSAVAMAALAAVISLQVSVGPPAAWNTGLVADAEDGVFFEPIADTEMLNGLVSSEEPEAVEEELPFSPLPLEEARVPVEESRRA
jgi:hypothetical protein